MSSALSFPRLRRILIAYTANRLGSWIGLVALSLAVYDHTRGSAGAGAYADTALPVAGLLLCWQALPAFLVPALVARVEASSRRYELSALYLIEALTTAAIAVLLSHFWLPGILGLAALDGTAALAASALLRAEVARCGREAVLGRDASLGELGKDQQDAVHEAERQANAALTLAFSAAFVGGPVLGGVAAAAFGVPAALLVDVASFAVCGVLLLDLHPHVEEAGASSVRARLNAAWQHIMRARALRSLLVVEAIALVFIQCAAPIEVIYAKSTLHAGDRGYGLLVTAWGAGTVLGGVLFARARHASLGAILSAGTFALGAAFVGYALAPTLALGCVAAAIGGLGNTLEWPALISLVQKLTPRQLHGRLMGAVESLSALCIAVGLLLGGVLVALSSARTAFLIIGLGTVIASLAFVRLTLAGLHEHVEDPAEVLASDPVAAPPPGALPHEPAT